MQIQKDKKVIVLGKLPPPYFGPSVATKIILNSELKNRFLLTHIDTTLNKNVSGIGKTSLKKIFSGFKIYLIFLRTLLKIKPSLILIPISQSSVGFYKDGLFVLIAHLFKKKVIIHLRGSNFKQWVDSTSVINRLYVLSVLKRTKGIIVLGNNLRYIFKDYFKEDKIFTVPNGADFQFPLKQKSSELKVVYFANFIEDKGFYNFLEAIKYHSENEKSHAVRFISAGDWNQQEFKNKCISFIEENKICIEILPPMSGTQKLKFFADADIFVFTPNKPEGHPWVIVEAMAAGLPIISTDQGAISESVIDGINGFIVDSFAPEQIAEKIEFLITNPEIRKKMGEESRRLYEANFTEEIMIDKLTNVFNYVIAND
jgi:glycosyltransferase involved in cell wall biosynthesis